MGLKLQGGGAKSQCRLPGRPPEGGKARDRAALLVLGVGEGAGTRPTVLGGPSHHAIVARGTMLAPVTHCVVLAGLGDRGAHSRQEAVSIVRDRQTHLDSKTPAAPRTRGTAIACQPPHPSKKNIHHTNATSGGPPPTKTSDSAAHFHPKTFSKEGRVACCLGFQPVNCLLHVELHERKNPSPGWHPSNATVKDTWHHHSYLLHGC